MARIADRNYVRWDILGYDRPGTDGYVVADGDSRKDGDAAADPYIVADGYWFSPFLTSVPLNRVGAVTGGIDADVRTDEAVVTDCHLGLVEHCEMEVREEPLSYGNLLAVVAIEWLVDDDMVITYMPKKPLQYFMSA